MTDFSRLNKLIYGWPKTGKTTFASYQVDTRGKEPLFIATEDGHHAIEVYVQRVTNWEGFLKLIDLLRSHKEQVKHDHSCFVIDLVTDLDAFCQEYVAKKAKIQHIADLEFGKGFALVAQEFQSAMRELMSLLPVTFIAHSQERDLVWNNEKIKVQAPSMSKKCLEYVNGKVDAIIWMTPANTKKAKPELTMRNSLTSIAGSRYKQLAKTWVFDTDDPSKTYKDIQKVFAGNKGNLVQEENNNPSPQPDEPKATASVVKGASVSQEVRV